MLSCNETNRKIRLIETKANATNAAYSCWELGYWILRSSCSCQISSGGCLNIPSGSHHSYCGSLGFGLLLYVYCKFWSISEGCQYIDKAVIFESLISHGEWATASQAEMGRPELVSVWDSSWPRARSAMLVANPRAVTEHVSCVGRLRYRLCVGLATMRHSALRAEPPFTLLYVP